MAEITNSTRTTPRPWNTHLSTPLLKSFPCSTGLSSATIAYGDVVQFDVNVSSQNFRIVKSSTMANVPNVLSSAVLGIALEADSAGTMSASALGGNVLVCCAVPQQEYTFPTKAAGTVFQSTLINTRRAIGYDSTLSMFYADLGNSTAGDASLIITGLRDAEGTTNGAVIAKFLSTGVARLISSAF